MYMHRIPIIDTHVHVHVNVHVDRDSDLPESLPLVGLYQRGGEVGGSGRGHRLDRSKLLQSGEEFSKHSN